ncbi:hypothetical protein [Parageobacillus galactosidasius]|uniref:Uncharacterized protein n=1 Tax=Parageobacillus galactosidasius TaxID=883812 RepID=A0A226QQZ7_9BACL|nr:hypothetical protein [Parageobacillus galactosidasius]OXB94765.1 hypothetical protein B9L23_07840 [Parageobacillus galactosidasius]
MPEIKVGLAQGKVSFFDPKTNTYITLDNPVQKIKFDDNTDLSGICHALFSQRPALVLYEGKLPQAAIDAWKAKYDLKGLQMAKQRADEIQAKSADVVTQNINKAEEVKMEAMAIENEKEVETIEQDDEKETEEVETAEKDDEKEENKQEEKKTSRKRKSKAADEE